ncbi:sugar O-acetyltransferase [Streptococcus porcinus]|uniref:Acetyltransferase n=2 Tax=Streptococcus porcinus TaxID=1340 RepID=A0A4V0H2N7_STRPO|nr:sugar O-acetyltransferase [Streptococcus porcinus]EGJ27719.1 putative maltose O-acetyltransferase [Streptococcus porcinus str. Jelinkova 176]SQG42761.1 acetyltransferase [Streptococcus porcinus]VTT41777.1 acetyltransferase [Streptococcus porcinus]VTT42963.1 acetyltransferase [Streptococcus porcinus]
MTTMTSIHSGQLYFPNDPQLIKKQLACQELLYCFNQTKPSEIEKRNQLMKEMFKSVGSNVFIEPPLRANWGGHFTTIGKNVYINFNLTLVDDTFITIGDNTMIAPNVTIISGTHPLQPSLREQGLQYNLPVQIGKNCWIGANTTVLPGISIGDNSVIGANSLVTKDIPANSLALGSPARVIKSLKEDK